MAHFAQLDSNNIVTQVIVVHNNDAPDEPAGLVFIAGTLKLDGVWKQTSYNGSFRKNYAGEGYLYDAVRDAFIAPTPYPSWGLNESTCRWDAPTPYPNIPDKRFNWDEATLSWRELP